MTASRTFASRQFSLRLSLSFGAVIALLMVIVVAVAVSLFTHLHEREETRLSSALAASISEAVTRVSFSGKYHARLLAEELKARVPELAYISVESPEGRVIAHSDPGRNGEQVSPEEAALDRQVAASHSPMVRERPF
ncbi:MAG TPA: hypothetical protein VN436_15625, partial [Holophaga sp.]|nr:hypothetical protein [Holophaga sp.]